jgi:hypothetical protein
MIMDFDEGMAETVAKHMPSPDQIASNQWLPEKELRVYSEEFGRTGFQGGLNWYRSGGIGTPEQQLFAGRTIDQPSIFSLPAFVFPSAECGSNCETWLLNRAGSCGCLC